MLLDHMDYNEVVQFGTQVFIFLKAVFGAPPEIQEGLLFLRFLHNFSLERKQNYFRRLTGNNDIICSRETHGKDEFLHVLQILAPRFQLFGTLKPNIANAGGSVIYIHKDLLPDVAIVTHVITCQGP